jgi:hypothetical protein
LRRGRPRIGLPEGISHLLLATPLLELSSLLDLDPRLLLLQRALRGRRASTACCRCRS